MGNVLYVYDFEKIDELKAYFAHRKIISIGSIFGIGINKNKKYV